METLLSLTQIVLSVLLIGGVLLQLSSSGLGEAFGGSNDSGPGHTRRGMEKWLFNGTIIIAILFVIVSVIAFFAN
jgi:preprotein translocase subunit SecG